MEVEVVWKVEQVEEVGKMVVIVVMQEGYEDFLMYMLADSFYKWLMPLFVGFKIGDY